MENKSLGFIGAGRITRIILRAFMNLNVSFRKIVIIDTNTEVLEQLKKDFPEIISTTDDLKAVVTNDVVFIALHPPVIMEMLEKIKGMPDKNTILVSLAPKITVGKIIQKLSGHKKVARLIPNAPSIINEGYNPAYFSEDLSGENIHLLTDIFEKLGKCIVIEEEKLEAYAIVTAMSPTYFWFQFQELYDIGKKIGLSDVECKRGISETIKASLNTLFESEFSKDEVFDLIPVKPISEYEAEIIGFYQTRLLPLFDKIKP
ncbi:MAG: NAD(P)-binding domain-containing protein [Bacteroidales bacterium]|nr:MAG: NAD(P)-binding domain-containing protein [Bacteroidales bacterium]